MSIGDWLVAKVSSNRAHLQYILHLSLDPWPNRHPAPILRLLRCRWHERGALRHARRYSPTPAPAACNCHDVTRWRYYDATPQPCRRYDSWLTAFAQSDGKLVLLAFHVAVCRLQIAMKVKQWNNILHPLLFKWNGPILIHEIVNF